MAVDNCCKTCGTLQRQFQSSLFAVAPITKKLKSTILHRHTHRQHCTLRAHRVFAIARSEEEQVGITIALITKALLSEAGFGKVFRTRIGSIDDFVSCWGKRGAYLVLLEPS